MQELEPTKEHRFHLPYDALRHHNIMHQDVLHLTRCKHCFPFSVASSRFCGLPHASSRFWAQSFLFSTQASIHDCPIYVGPPRLRTVSTLSPFPLLSFCTLLPFPHTHTLSSVCPPYVSHYSPCSPSCSRHQFTWVPFCCVSVPP